MKSCGVMEYSLVSNVYVSNRVKTILTLDTVPQQLEDKVLNPAIIIQYIKVAVILIYDYM